MKRELDSLREISKAGDLEVHAFFFAPMESLSFEVTVPPGRHEMMRGRSSANQKE
jgi:hypothetical protein